jgi:hypothetical protein
VAIEEEAARQQEAEAEARRQELERLRAEQEQLVAANRELAERLREEEQRRKQAARLAAVNADQARLLASSVEEARREKAAAERREALAANQARAAEARANAVAQSSQARERALTRKLEQLDDWERYQIAARRENIDADKLPVLDLPERSPGEFLELLKFYGMEVVCYPKDGRFLVQVDPRTGAMQRITDRKAFMARFASRGIEQRGARRTRLAEQVASRFEAGVPEMQVWLLMPQRTAHYFAWKQLEALRRAGLDPEEVATCYGRYERTVRGTWVVEIGQVAMMSGRRISIR